MSNKVEVTKRQEAMIKGITAYFDMVALPGKERAIVLGYALQQTTDSLNKQAEPDGTRLAAQITVIANEEPRIFCGAIPDAEAKAFLGEFDENENNDREAAEKAKDIVETFLDMLADQCECDNCRRNRQ